MRETDTRAKTNGRSEWPLLLRLSPRSVMVAILVWLAFAWALFLVVDIWAWIDFRTDRTMWGQLFNNRPVEWTQWFVLALAVVAAAYLAGILRATGQSNVERFFFLMAIGQGLMLIEEAGDIRHVISNYVRILFGQEIFGLHHRVVSEVPYFALLAALPLYAVGRYGRYAWQSVPTRPYLTGGLLLYAIAGLSNGLRHLGRFYRVAGAWVDQVVFAGRFPFPDSMTQDTAHFQLIDGVLEETVELLAAAMILAAILAFAGDVRARMEPRSPDSSHLVGG